MQLEGGQSDDGELINRDKQSTSQTTTAQHPVHPTLAASDGSTPQSRSVAQALSGAPVTPLQGHAITIGRYEPMAGESGIVPGMTAQSLLNRKSLPQPRSQGQTLIEQPMTIGAANNTDRQSSLEIGVPEPRPPQTPPRPPKVNKVTRLRRLPTTEKILAVWDSVALTYSQMLQIDEGKCKWSQADTIAVIQYFEQLILVKGQE